MIDPEIYEYLFNPETRSWGTLHNRNETSVILSIDDGIYSYVRVNGEKHINSYWWSGYRE